MKYKVCSRCVMDSTAMEISFDKNGFCNYCIDFLNKIDKQRKLQFNSEIKDSLISNIKIFGKNKNYDCIVGVSGGVDSSYVLYLAVKNGLRPLAVHLDNGWNSELAVNNISNLVNTLGVDLYTHVIDWEENKDMQLSFFKANVVDIEMLMDNAMLKLNYSMASKYKLKFILSGSNTVTEGLRMPPKWLHYKFDKKNIINIHKKFGSMRINTHPLISTIEYLKYEYLQKIKWVSFLDYFEYNKQEALNLLQKEVGYKPYPYKHYESVFTRFYQAYILPKKFNIDKRRVHLSTLIMSGQMSRDEALSSLEHSPYPDSAQEKSDKAFVIKKLDFTEKSFEKYINTPKIDHSYYGSERWISQFLKSIQIKFQKKV